MDVVEKTRGFLSNWSKSGESDWYVETNEPPRRTPFFPCFFMLPPQLIANPTSLFSSRKCLTQLHSSPADANAVDALATAYHTLLSATLSLWSPKHSLTPAAFAAFVKSMLLSLPSSSQDAPSPAATALGELLVDTMWSIDSQLDDVVADSKATIAAQSEKEKEQVNGRAEESGAVLSRDAATKDKATLLEVVKLLLVRRLVFVLLEDWAFERLVCVEGWRRKSRPLQRTIGDVACRSGGPHLGQALVRQKGSTGAYGLVVRISIFLLCSTSCLLFRSYKQNKFNLLREHSEGFSKLITEVTSALPSPHSPATALPLEPSSIAPERVQPIWERIVSLIGYFDLDPNRALDVILDLFSAYLTTHWSFFLVLLSLSPWKGQCGSFTWINEERVEPMKEEDSTSKFKGKSLDEVLSMAESTDLSRTTPVQSTPRVMAQVLGFKFRHYQVCHTHI